MTKRDQITSAIMLIALAAMGVLVFNLPVGMSPRIFGAIAFGAILLFGALSILMTFIDVFHKRTGSDK